MPRSKNKTRRPHPYPLSVVEAANKVLNNQMSLRQAALEYNVTRSTLCRH